MKYSKIAKFIKQRKSLYCTEYGGVQWISDGTAIYPLYRMPELDEKAMLTFLGLESKDVSHIVFDFDLPQIDFDDTVARETMIDAFGPKITVRGDDATVLYTDIGAVVIKSEYLEPVLKVSDDTDGTMTIWLRYTSDGNYYVAVKHGLYLFAVIMPYKLKDTNTSATYSRLLNMLRQAEDNDKYDNPEAAEIGENNSEE